MNINIIKIFNKLKENGELFAFIETLFGIKPKAINYKIANDNLIINIFTNEFGNQLISYVFLNEYNDTYIKKEINDNFITNYIYVKKCIELVNEEKENKLILFASTL